jgi:hypothetical protein
LFTWKHGSRDHQFIFARKPFEIMHDLFREMDWLNQISRLNLAPFLIFTNFTSFYYCYIMCFN